MVRAQQVGVALLCLWLGACGQTRYYKDVSETAIKEAKNIEAETLVAVPCLIGLGAFFRLDDENQKKALVLLCGNGQEMPEMLE